MNWRLAGKTEWVVKGGDGGEQVHVAYLTALGWGGVFIVALLLLWGIPALWLKIESIPDVADYRIPYKVTEDYWTMRQWISRARGADSVLFMGDSVIWGQYATPAETLTGCLNRRITEGPRCHNLGLDGGHPVGLVELVRTYGHQLRGQRVVLYFSPLWISAPLFEMKGPKVQYLFHTRLLPQFDDTLECYKATRKERWGIWLERQLSLVQLERHWRITWMDGKPWEGRLLGGTGTVARATIGRTLAGPDEKAPVEPVTWRKGGGKTAGVPWSSLDQSRQAAAFLELIRLLQARGNSVFVLVGSYNTHMLTPDNIAVYEKVLAGMKERLNGIKVPLLSLPVLETDLYGDASHPLPAGYEWIADFLIRDQGFRDWMGVRGVVSNPKNGEGAR